MKFQKPLLAIHVFTLISIMSCISLPARPIVANRGDYSPLKEYMSVYIQKLMKRYNVVGASVMLIDDQKIAWAQGFGYADKKRSIPSTQDTVYTVSSLTKLFTASAVMQLVEEGKINLDAPVNEYIPEFKIKSRYPDQCPITVRMLLTHHSGLPSDWGQGLFCKKPLSFRSIINYLKDKYLSYPPNYMFNYSNLGVNLLGIIIERVSGMEFNDYVNERIFKPLDMTSSWLPPVTHSGAVVSLSYSNGKEADELCVRDVPSSSLYTNSTDLSRFVVAMHNRGASGTARILKPETVERMMVSQNEDIPMDMNKRIGLIWHLGRKRLDYAGRVCYHHGLSLYHRSTLVMLPDHRLTALVLCNTDTGDKMMEQIADDMLRLALEIKTGIIPVNPTPPKETILSKDEMNAYIGTFATLKGLARIVKSGDSLKLKISGFTLNMVPNDDGFFMLQYKLLGFIPLGVKELEDVRATVKTIGSSRVLVMERDGLSTVVGEEIKGRMKIPPEWIRRVGRYRAINDQNEYRLFVDTLDIEYREGILRGIITSDKFDIGTLNLILEPINNNEALIKALGRSGRETLYVKSDENGEVIEYSGYLFRKIN